MSRRGDYLFKRKNSQNWWIRFQYTGKLRQYYGPKTEISLGTPDRKEAEILAFEHIQLHKKLLLFFSKLEEMKKTALDPEPKHEIGKIIRIEDGGYSVATAETISYYNSDMVLIGTEPNINMVKLRFRVPIEEFKRLEPYLKKTEHPDDNIIESWIKHQKLNNHIAREARDVWGRLKIITNNRRMDKVSRDDARKLVSELEEIGNKSATINKKIGHLRAASNYAITEGLFKTNPFIKLVGKSNDKIKRLPLSDDDMTKVRNNLHRLSSSDQILWKLLSCTGMRLDEPFQIVEDFREDGIRYVKVGTKTASSYRDVPIPTDLLKDIPSKIEGPLFEGGSETAGKRLRYFLREIGVSYHSIKKTGDERKVIHSLRHRALDRLRSFQCPDYIMKEIVGHERSGITPGYGSGSPKRILLSYIDRIGY